MERRWRSGRWIGHFGRFAQPFRLPVVSAETESAVGDLDDERPTKKRAQERTFHLLRSDFPRILRVVFGTLPASGKTDFFDFASVLVKIVDKTGL